ncbi:LysM peptidoglycan-binding domain-containing protein [Lysinibacillus sp. NPDC097287]|uniref:C40 family peptidase n=1 Tax=Lysinibacillus sp. NPDC097287 TaxID=3364144 RepID=UPI0038233625
MQKSKKWGIFTLGTIAISFFAIQTADAATYIVQKGDTLSKIAQTHQVTIADIKKWNNLSKDTIFVSQKLQVELHAPVEVPKPTVVTHTVAKGDTLSKIARQYNVTLKEIKEWNALTTDNIYIGQALKVNPVVIESEKDEIYTNLPTYEDALSQVISKNPTANGQAIYNKTIDVANTLIGTPYLYGGNSPIGLDCSGFIYYAFNQGGLKIARDSSEGYFFGKTTKVNNPLAGDLVFFENTYKAGISHMGIYIGNNKFIHAGTVGVEVSDVTNSYWSSRLVAYKRFNDIPSY